MNNPKLFDEMVGVQHEAELTVLSMGLGQDSFTILLMLIHDRQFRQRYAPGKLLVVFSDTGNEHELTYKFEKETVIPLCQEHDIEYVSLSSDMGYHNKNWLSLTHQWQHKKPTVGSMAFVKTCTHNLKLQPQYNFVEKWLAKEYKLPYGRKRGFVKFAAYYGPIKWLIGIARGEEKRVKNAEVKEVWRNKSIQTEYPLMDVGYNRSDCQTYIKDLGHPVPMPSNCMFCPFASNHIELLWLYKNDEVRFYEWVEYEQKKLDAWKDGGSINHGVSARLHKNGEAVTLLDLLDEAIKKYGHMTLEELQEYKWSHGHNVASTY